jgi:hypothetical protein
VKHILLAGCAALAPHTAPAQVYDSHGIPPAIQQIINSDPLLVERAHRYGAIGVYANRELDNVVCPDRKPTGGSCVDWRDGGYALAQAIASTDSIFQGIAQREIACERSSDGSIKDLPTLAVCLRTGLLFWSEVARAMGYTPDPRAMPR